MINTNELAICNRRGHERPYEGWTRCKWCGIWLREVRTIEFREDDPPEDEQDIRYKVQRMSERLEFPPPETPPADAS